jgi:hypothetical protein
MKFNYKDAEKNMQTKFKSESGDIANKLIKKYYSLVEKKIKEIIDENKVLDFKDLRVQIMPEELMKLGEERKLCQTCFIYLKDKLVSRIEMYLDGVEVYRYEGE